MELLNATLAKIHGLDKEAMTKAQAHQDILTKPRGSLGKLEAIAVQLAGIQGNAKPQTARKAIITMAGDHGIIDEKFHNWPKEVTAQMLQNFAHGGAAINVLSRQVGARNVVVALGVATPMAEDPNIINRNIAPGTNNMVYGPAMTREQAVKAIETGIEIVNAEVKKGLDLVGTGDMGIGNTSPSAAICSVITGRSLEEVTGRGTGASDEQMKLKRNAIAKAIALNKPNAQDALDVLSKVGGYEIGGLAGVILGAAANRVGVVVDGFISGAAALIAYTICPQAKDFMFAAHQSVEPGHRILLEHMGMDAILKMDMRLGEGTGAALAMNIIEASNRIQHEMASFADAGVSEKQS